MVPRDALREVCAPTLLKIALKCLATLSVATWPASDYENEPRHYIILGSCATQAIFNDSAGDYTLCAGSKQAHIIQTCNQSGVWCMFVCCGTARK
jgi:hypothetical protein